MELEIKIEGQGITEQTLFSIQDWIKQEGITSVTPQIKTSPIKKGEMGGELSNVLSVVLTSSGKIIELFRSLHNWILSRNIKVNLEISNGERSIKISSENLQDFEKLESLIEKASLIFTESNHN